MNVWLAIPPELRLAALGLLGVLLGVAANLAAYRLAWNPRLVSPWSPAPPQAPPRRPMDRIPILGWLGLRREASLHGPGFWVRPMLVELLGGLGLAALYGWEVFGQGLKPHAPVAVPDLPPWDVHVQFLLHAALFWLMLVASLIDLDEKTIPDSITVPGTLLGLVAAAVYPFSLLPVLWLEAGGLRLGFLHLTSPHPPPAWLVGFRSGWGLAIAWGCWWLWCVALLHRTWYGRHGWRRAFTLMVARLVRARWTPLILLMGVAGSIAIGAVWAGGGVLNWRGLLSALAGMAGGGSLIWLVRIVGRGTLGREAMGFGDVTLVAMIGTVIGWQGCLVVFFLGAIFGAIGGLAPLVLRRESVIPYGPFLCLAAAVTILRFPVFWDYLENVLDQLGLLLPMFLVTMFVAMVPLLWIVRSIRLFLFPERT